MVKYGDVVEFTYGGQRCVAMVLVTSTEKYIVTDEGTALSAFDHGMIVYGIVKDGPEQEFHGVGRTATLIHDDYKVIG